MGWQTSELAFTVSRQFMLGEGGISNRKAPSIRLREAPDFTGLPNPRTHSLKTGEQDKRRRKKGAK
jgi:hypothetical protein